VHPTRRRRWGECRGRRRRRRARRRGRADEHAVMVTSNMPTGAGPNTTHTEEVSPDRAFMSMIDGWLPNDHDPRRPSSAEQASIASPADNSGRIERNPSPRSKSKEDAVVRRSRHPVNVKLIDEAPLGARVADRVTGYLGSWRFIVIQTVIVGSGWSATSTCYRAVRSVPSSCSTWRSRRRRRTRRAHPAGRQSGVLRDR